MLDLRAQEDSLIALADLARLEIRVVIAQHERRFEPLATAARPEARQSKLSASDNPQPNVARLRLDVGSTTTTMRLGSL